MLAFGQGDETTVRKIQTLSKSPHLSSFIFRVSRKLVCSCASEQDIDAKYNADTDNLVGGAFEGPHHTGGIISIHPREERHLPIMRIVSNIARDRLVSVGARS